MSPSESNPESSLVSATPVVLSEGQRSLAAIVFTDAVNFSFIMSRDEILARRLIGRDLSSMRASCVESGGQVLKSTGDGLLMVFDSAVRAVSCALDIQTRLRQQNRALPFSERLSHRIGIHLGDVFRQENDVIGDGVNIAARMETVAWRGCVCVSSTVYEVIRNRLPFHMLWRKERKLKNVGKMVVCQLAPVGGRFDFFFRAWAFLRLSDPRVLRLILGLIAFLAIGILPGRINVDLSDFGISEDPLHPYAVQLGQLGNVNPVADDSETTEDASAALPAAGKRIVSPDEFAVARFNDIRKYDFAAMADWLTKNDLGDHSGARLRSVSLSIQQLFDWARLHLQTYNEANPLLVRDDEGRTTCEFWSAPDHGIACKLTSSESRLLNDQIPPVLMGQMLARLLEQDPQDDAPASQNLWRGLKLFTAVYQVNLPSALKKEMNTNAKAAVAHEGKS